MPRSPSQDDVKFAWKAQRDIAERGATMEEVQEAIDARKPDFAAYVEPQKAKADIVVQVPQRPHMQPWPTLVFYSCALLLPGGRK